LNGEQYTTQPIFSLEKTKNKFGDLSSRKKTNFREGKGREEKGREGKRREGKRREGLRFPPSPMCLSYRNVLRFNPVVTSSTKTHRASI